MSDDNKALVRRIFEIMGTGETDGIEALVAPDYVDHANPAPSPPGPEGFVSVVQWLRTSFPDLRYELEDVVAEGDRVAVRCQFTGTHLGEFVGMAPTEKHVSVKHMHILRVAEGRVAEHWAVRDDVGMMMQLGRFPGQPG